MNRVKWIWIACLAASLAACAGASREYVLTGKLKHCTDHYALLHANDAGEEMDTIAIALDGTFRYAKTIGASSMSFLMLEKGGVFPLLLIDGTENHLEADLATPGQYRVTGDLEAASAFYREHLKDFSRITEERENSFKGLHAAYADYQREVLERLTGVPDRGFHALFRETLERQIKSTLVTYWGKWRGKEPVSNDADYNRFMEEVDLGSSRYAAKVLLFTYLSWFKEYRLEKGGDNLYQYLLSVVEERVIDPAMQQQGYEIVFSDMFSKGDAFGEAEAVYNRGSRLVTDPELHAWLIKEYAAFKQLQPGAPVPDCEWSDKNGKSSRLSDLCGKVIYLDVWATTCRPCCAEIPCLVRLVEHFKGASRVEFVSVSVDVNRQAWLDKLARDKPRWKQFWKKDFSQLYNVDIIPRFMLFDSEGKIITLDAPRPSDPGIIGFLEGHLE